VVLPELCLLLQGHVGRSRPCILLRVVVFHECTFPEVLTRWICQLLRPSIWPVVLVCLMLVGLVVVMCVVDRLDVVLIPICQCVGSVLVHLVEGSAG
jgi:hypothetical protein